MFIAAQYGSTAVYSYLVENGVSPDGCGYYTSLPARESPDVNPIMPAVGVAIARGDLTSVKMLVDLGAELSTQCKPPVGRIFNYSAILSAAVFGDVDIMRYLLARGENPNTLSTYGMTPLAIAAARGNYALVKVLLESGAYHTYKEAPKQPIELAMEHDHAEVAAMLRRAGGLVPKRNKQVGETTDIAEVVINGAILAGTVWLMVEAAKHSCNTDGDTVIRQCWAHVSSLKAEIYGSRGYDLSKRL